MAVDNNSAYTFDVITGKSLIKPYAIGVNARGDVFVANSSDATVVRIASGSLTPDPETVPWGGPGKVEPIHMGVDAATSDVMILTYNALYRIPGGNNPGIQITCPSRPELLQAMTGITQDRDGDWYVCTNTAVVRVPRASNEADPSPITGGGLQNCAGIAAHWATRSLYVTNPGSRGSGATVTCIPDLGVGSTPFPIGGFLFSPRMIVASPWLNRVYVTNTGVPSSVAVIDPRTHALAREVIAGGGIVQPAAMTAADWGDIFVLNGNDTLTRIPQDVADLAPESISGGGMNGCRDVCAYRSQGTAYLWVTNQPSNSVTRISWTYVSTATTLSPGSGPRRLPFTATATVTPAGATGTVTFTTDPPGPAIPPVALVARQAQHLFDHGDLPRGNVTVTATYNGDGSHTGSNASQTYLIENT